MGEGHDCESQRVVALMRDWFAGAARRD